MTAWPPEIPDPFDPKRTAFGRKIEGTWGRITETDKLSPPAVQPRPVEKKIELPAAPELPPAFAPEPEDQAVSEAKAKAVPVVVPGGSESELEMDDIEQSAEHFRSRFQLLKSEVQKIVVGQEDVVDHVITAMVAGGHVLVEGVPGLGKTTLVRAIASALSLFYQRVQFTADLEAADLVGTDVLVGDAPGQLEFSPGPIFCNLLLADQINRAPPKTQAMLLEAMEEKCVTIGGQARLIAEPFFVLATQNPEPEEGTYPLPQAQLDRFFFSVPLAAPTVEEMETILERTTEAALPVLEPVFPGDDLALMHDFAKGVLIEPPLRHQIAELVTATHPDADLAGSVVKKYVRSGASPRAAQALVMAAKIRALREGRFHVVIEDVLAFAIAVLRHRIVLTPRAQLDELRVEDILSKMLEQLYGHWR